MVYHCKFRKFNTTALSGVECEFNIHTVKHCFILFFQIDRVGQAVCSWDTTVSSRKFYYSSRPTAIDWDIGGVVNPNDVVEASVLAIFVKLNQ